MGARRTTAPLDGISPAERRYKPRRLLRTAVAAAAALWGAVLVLLVRDPSSDPRSVLGAALFATFFLAFSFVYAATWIAVTGEGIVASTPFRRRPVPFEDIVEIRVIDGLAGRVYAVFTRRGLVHFTSLFARHRELFELLLDRAALGPRASM
jgi:hypothetical protein